MKLAQNLGQIDPHKRRYGLFVGCFLVSLAYLSMSKPYPTPIPTVNSQILSIHAALTSPSLEDITNSRQSDCNGARENGTQKSKLRCNVSNPRPDLGGMVDANMMPKNSSTNDPSPQGKDANNAQQLESNNKMETSQISDESKSIRYEMDGDTGVPENSSAKVIESTKKVEPRDSKQLESTNKMEKSLKTDGSKSLRYEIDGDTRVHENSSAKAIDSIERLEARYSKQLESTDKMEKSQIGDDPKSVRYGLIDGDTRVLENSSAKAIDSTERLEARDSKQLEVRSEDVKPETKLMCDFSDTRSDVCEMDGDIRIIGKFSSVIFVTSSQMGNSERKESWRIRPYARKSDSTAMANVREVFLKSSDGNEEAPRCTVNHSSPAIVFSDAGFTGNYFHDFSDVLVPLFQTSHQFNGEVQFLVTNFRYWWIHKYLPIFKMLSRYEIIDFDNDDRVHCFQHTIVGLRSNRDLNIDPSRSPEGYSMAEFAKFMRNAYSLERDSLVRMRKIQNGKPRLLIIARSRTRRFTNLDKIVRMARKLGYEVVVAENDGGSDVAQFAHIVNSCDVMMGVHGAGLTNLVFLPTNAILIQIVPWGSLDWIAGTYFREPAKEMKLRYLEYSISQEESTLKELYPRDHPVFKDPMSIHKLGWNAMGDIYLVKQNVQLNVRRFRGVLSKALKLLHQ